MEIPFSDGSRRILRYAAEEADRAGHRHIGVDHLVAGILREADSFAAGMLRARGLTLDRVRAIVLESAEPERPAAAFDAAASVERIRILVEHLAQQTADRDDARATIDEVHRLLDGLKARLS